MTFALQYIFVIISIWRSKNQLNTKLEKVLLSIQNNNVKLVPIVPINFPLQKWGFSILKSTLRFYHYIHKEKPHSFDFFLFNFFFFSSRFIIFFQQSPLESILFFNENFERCRINALRQE